MRDDIAFYLFMIALLALFVFGGSEDCNCAHEPTCQHYEVSE